MTSTRLLRIAVTADPAIPVPPKLYGGAERLVDMLVCGLLERGHDVTLFAHPDSDVPCTLEPYPGRQSQSKGDLLRNMWHVSSKILQGRYDLVHSFGRLVYLLPILPLSIPKLMSYERGITARSVVWGERLSRRTLHFTGCSHYMMKSYIAKSNWHLVYPGVPKTNYNFREQVSEDAPLIFLGRVEEVKGVHLAIEVARRSGRSLVIAGNVPEGPKHQTYFEEKISTHIDGRTVRYVGPVSDGQKDELLGRAVALLMPILWEEPFGMVMAEALACGTPVIGLRRGAVPEVVQDGYNGFVCESIEEMAAAVKRIKEIDRRVCRQIMEEKFSDRAVIEECEKLYVGLVNNRPAR